MIDLFIYLIVDIGFFLIEYLNYLLWSLVVLSIAGKIFIIKKSVVGFYLWAISDIMLAIYNMFIGSTAQAVLFILYFGFSFWGILNWKKNQK